MSWLQIDANLPTKPEVRRICRKTGEDTARVIGRLLIFWAQIDQHGDFLDEDERPEGRPDLDGIIPDYELDDLIDICGGDESFWSIVAETGWIHVDVRRGLLFPGFEARFHISAKRRAETARRKQRQRARELGVIGTSPKKIGSVSPDSEPSPALVIDVEPVTETPSVQEFPVSVTNVTPVRDKNVTRERERVSESESQQINTLSERPPKTAAAGGRGNRNFPWRQVTDARLESAVKHKKPAIIETLWHESVKAGWIKDTQHLRHRFYSAVVYGVRTPSVESAKGLLTFKVKHDKWESGTEEADREAKRLMQIEDGIDLQRVSNLAPEAPNIDQARDTAIAQLTK